MAGSRTFQLGLDGIQSINGSSIDKAPSEVAIASMDQVQMQQGPQESMTANIEQTMSGPELAL